jgi:50S ribosomal protein L16 3-hydroxylase
MKFPGDLSPGSFLTQHWQKKPLFMPDAIQSESTVPLPLLAPEELAWLATLDDVESRLIFTEQHQGSIRYRVEHGPFEDTVLSALPQSGWTLLVQDVEKHLPDFRQWLSLVQFIPEWRIDDLMISFAAAGGSVGPHKDNYDVFLCQATGQREWRLARPDDNILPATCEHLALLQPFTDPAPTIAASGDVLYLPPAVPHWGIAMDSCMTLSIGMRAPTLAELRCAFERAVPDAANPFKQSADENALFYADPALRDNESQHGRISQQAVERCRKLTTGSVAVTDKALATALGCVVTDLKAWLAPESPERVDGADYPTTSHLAVHGMARIAWWAEQDELLVFANGGCMQAAPVQTELVQSLCERRELTAKRAKQKENTELIDWLWATGAFDFSG